MSRLRATRLPSTESLRAPECGSTLHRINMTLNGSEFKGFPEQTAVSAPGAIGLMLFESFQVFFSVVNEMESSSRELILS